MQLKSLTWVLRSGALILVTTLLVLMAKSASAFNIDRNNFPWDREFRLTSNGNTYQISFTRPDDDEPTFELNAQVSVNGSKPTPHNFSIGTSTGVHADTFYSVKDIEDSDAYYQNHQPLILLGAIGLTLLFMNKPYLYNDLDLGEPGEESKAKEKYVKDFFAKECRFFITTPQDLTFGLPLPPSEEVADSVASALSQTTSITLVLSAEPENMSVQFHVTFHNSQGQQTLATYDMPVEQGTPLLSQEFLMGDFFEAVVCEDSDPDSYSYSDSYPDSDSLPSYLPPEKKSRISSQDNGDDSSEEISKFASTINQVAQSLQSPHNNQQGKRARKVTLRLLIVNKKGEAIDILNMVKK